MGRLGNSVMSTFKAKESNLNWNKGWQKGPEGSRVEGGGKLHFGGLATEYESLSVLLRFGEDGDLDKGVEEIHMSKFIHSYC